MYVAGIADVANGPVVGDRPFSSFVVVCAGYFSPQHNVIVLQGIREGIDKHEGKRSPVPRYFYTFLSGATRLLKPNHSLASNQVPAVSLVLLLA